MSNDQGSSPGRLYIDEFLDKHLAEYADCLARYEHLTPDELVNELSFLAGKEVRAIPFELTAMRYYALLTSLINCAASFEDLTDNERSSLVNMAIDLRALLIERTSVDKRKAFDDALSATIHRTKTFGLFPIVGDLIANEVRDYEGEFRRGAIGTILQK